MPDLNLMSLWSCMIYACETTFPLGIPFFFCPYAHTWRLGSCFVGFLLLVVPYLLDFFKICMLSIKGYQLFQVCWFPHYTIRVFWEHGIYWMAESFSKSVKGPLTHSALDVFSCKAWVFVVHSSVTLVSVLGRTRWLNLGMQRKAAGQL